MARYLQKKENTDTIKKGCSSFFIIYYVEWRYVLGCEFPQKDNANGLWYS
jgi:hypothetical protein